MSSKYLALFVKKSSKLSPELPPMIRNDSAATSQQSSLPVTPDETTDIDPILIVRDTVSKCQPCMIVDETCLPEPTIQNQPSPIEPEAPIPDFPYPNIVSNSELPPDVQEALQQANKRIAWQARQARNPLPSFKDILGVVTYPADEIRRRREAKRINAAVPYLMLLGLFHSPGRTVGPVSARS